MERPGGDDYLPCLERALIGVGCEPVAEVFEPGDGTVDLHGQFEAGGVASEVVGHLVLPRICVLWCWEGHAREPVVLSGRE